MVKVGLYARVSSEKQEQEGTIRSQISALKDYAKQNDYEIVDEYIDDGYSGELLARPELDRMRDDADRGKFQKTLVLAPDRLARNYAYQYLILEEFKKKEIEVEFTNYKIGDSPEDELLLQMQGAVAQYEKAKILERSRRGKLAQVKNDRIIGNIAPYGYSYEAGTPKEQREYIIDSEEAEVVKTIFSLYLKEQSLARVSKRLKEMGIPPKKRGEAWRHSTLYRVLRDETYIGKTYYGKHKSVEKETKSGYRRTKKSGRAWRDRSEWLMITTKPIIDQDIFDTAQRLLSKRFRPFGVSKVGYMLSGLLRCAKCGNTFAGEYSHNYRYYRCSNRQRRNPLPRTCDAVLVNSDLMEKAVWKAMSELLSKPSELIKAAGLGAEEQEANKSKEVSFLRGLELIKNKLDKEIQRRDRLVEVYRDGDIPKDAYQLKMEASHNAIETLKSEKLEKEKILAQAENIPLIKEVIRNFSRLMKSRMDKLSFDEKKMLLRIIIDKIIVDSNKKSLIIKGIIPSREPEQAVNGLFSQVQDLVHKNSGQNSYNSKKAETRR